MSPTERLTGTVARVVPLKTRSLELLLVETAFEGRLEMIKGVAPVGCFSERAAVRFCVHQHWDAREQAHVVGGRDFTLAS